MSVLDGIKTYVRFIGKKASAKKTDEDRKKERFHALYEHANSRFLQADVGLGQSDESVEDEGMAISLAASQTGFEALESQEQIDEIITLIKVKPLSYKEWSMLYYILSDSHDHGRMITDFAKEWGVTRQRASQVFIRLQQKLSAHFIRLSNLPLSALKELETHPDNLTIDFEQLKARVEQIISESDHDEIMRLSKEKRAAKEKQGDKALIVKPEPKQPNKKDVKVKKKTPSKKVEVQRSKSANDAKKITSEVVDEVLPSKLKKSDEAIKEKTVETKNKASPAKPFRAFADRQALDLWLVEVVNDRHERYAIKLILDGMSQKQITKHKVKIYLSSVDEQVVKTLGKKARVGFERLKKSIDVVRASCDS